MKEFVFSKLGYCVTIALLAPLSTVSAADVNDHIQAHLGGDGVTQIYDSSSWSASQGAQGPIRTDLMVDQAIPDGIYPYAEDAPADRFAYPEDAPRLPAASVGADSL